MRRSSSPSLVRSARLVVSVAVPAALATVLVAACGGPPTPPPPPPPLPRYATVADLGTAIGNQIKVDKTAKITLVGTVTGGAAQPTTNDEQLIRYEPTGVSVQVTRRVQQPGAPVPLESTTIVLPDQAYVKPPPGSGLPLGKSWIRIPASSPVPWMQQLIAQVQFVREAADPTKTFAQFGQAAGITEAADDQVDGVRAVRYKVRFDLAKAAEQQTDPALKRQLQAAPPSVDATLWLDERNRVLRQLAQQPGEDGIETVDAHYRDWGQPVEINPPPPDQVVDG